MKKIFILLLTAAFIFALGACGDSVLAGKTPPSAETEAPIQLIVPEASEPEDAPAEDAAPGVPVTLYFGYDNCEYIISEPAEVSELTPQALADLLFEKGVFSSAFTVNSFSIDPDGVMKLDLSKEFSSMIRSTGTAGEHIMMGSLVNTFIDAFDLEGLYLSVDGVTLESGHCIYDQMLGFYEQ